MGVPAHDERDFEFAQKYNLPIQKTIASPEEFAEYTALDTKENANEQEEERIEELATVLQGNVPYTQDGYILAGYGENEELLEAVIGLSSSEARTTLLHYAQEHGFGRKKINYKLRDWIFSRQRYWGEPMPIIHISHETIAKLPRIQRALVTAHPHELL
jgi:leucyl-tRNA synthetase